MLAWMRTIEPRISDGWPLPLAFRSVEWLSMALPSAPSRSP